MAEDAKCELELYSRWWQARRMKWEEMKLKDFFKKKRRIELECEFVKFQNQDKKYKKFRKKNMKQNPRSFKLKKKRNLQNKDITPLD